MEKFFFKAENKGKKILFLPSFCHFRIAASLRLPASQSATTTPKWWFDFSPSILSHLYFY